MVNSTGSIGSGIELQCVLKSDREKKDRREQSEKNKACRAERQKNAVIKIFKHLMAKHMKI